ncbi:hypothetical protein MGSAQ_002712 [marine sediment metagenome]|uniref:Uncharacterized protein n=1 Tax=marine sediment metagenome TaxID=412755 RepID=A0A1B6NS94_9ZZZZ
MGFCPVYCRWYAQKHVLIVQRCLANVGRIQFYTAKHATSI